jgi:ribose-phosphate pyrophosphokinase
VVELSEVLIESGIQRITLICTHGLFLGPAIERIKSIPQIQEVITTDTVERPFERQPPNLTVLSVGNVFAEAIRQNYFRRSIGELFEGMET